MSLPEEDLAARGRSIFERLRQERDPDEDNGVQGPDGSPSAESPPDTGPDTGPGAVRSEPLAVVGNSPAEPIDTAIDVAIDSESGEGVEPDIQQGPVSASEPRPEPEVLPLSQPDAVLDAGPEAFSQPEPEAPPGPASLDEPEPGPPIGPQTAGSAESAAETELVPAVGSSPSPAAGEPASEAEVISVGESQAAAAAISAPETEPPPAARPQVEAEQDRAPGPEHHPEGDREPVPVPPPEPARGPQPHHPLPGTGANATAETEVAPAGQPAGLGTREPERELDPQRFMRPLPRVLAVANQKGGVGKTTTTVNLGASLAVLGYRVLVVDLDPQGNATTGLGINSRNLESSIYDVILHDVPLDDCVEASQLRNLFVAPATIDLAGAEIELVPAFSRELRLRRALEDVREDYDFVLIDCPPSLGLLTVNALSAATEVVVPIQCEYYALEGLGQLLRNVNLVQSNLNPKLELSAIVLTMYDGRTRLAEQVADEVRQHFGDKVCRNVVPRTVRLSEAPSFGQPIIVFDPSSRGALAYRELAREVSGGPPQRTG